MSHNTTSPLKLELLVDNFGFKDLKTSLSVPGRKFQKMVAGTKLHHNVVRILFLNDLGLNNESWFVY